MKRNFLVPVTKSSVEQWKRAKWGGLNNEWQFLGRDGIVNKKLSNYLVPFETSLRRWGIICFLKA